MSSFKIVIIGGESVGKTSLVKKIFRKTLPQSEEPTQAVVAQNLSMTIQSLSQDINLEVYDLPGQENFMILNRMYLRDTNAALVVYDCTSRESMAQAQTWVDELKETAPEQCIMALAGNKMDQSNKQVSMQDGQSFARQHKITICSEVSAVSGENVDSLFQKIGLACYQKKDQFVSNPIPRRLNLSEPMATFSLALAHERDLQAGSQRRRYRANRRKEEKGLLLRARQLMRCASIATSISSSLAI